jgi:xanthine dehydrogenase accessory factor
LDETILALLVERAAAGVACALATVVRTESPTSAHPGDEAVIDADGRLSGWIGGSCSEPLVRREALAAMADGQPRLVRIRPSDEVGQVRGPGELVVTTTCPSGGALDIFIDPQLPPPLLVVFGGSPAAQALLRLAPAVGFRTCLVDRGSAGISARDADRVIRDTDLAELRERRDTWVVVATMGHDDEGAISAALTLPHADIALVASQRRAAAVLDTLRRSGIGETEVGRVRSPAGERRGGTQAEIALHALAEIVGRRRGRLAPTLGGTSSGPSGVEGGAMPDEGHAGAAALGFATDPVCGMTVDLAAGHPSVELDGGTFHFCCEACAQRFREEPARYSSASAGTA